MLCNAQLLRTSVQIDSPFAAPAPAGLRRTKLRVGGRSLRLAPAPSAGRLLTAFVSFRALSLDLNLEGPRFGIFSSVAGVVVTSSSLGGGVAFVRRRNVRLPDCACGSTHDHEVAQNNRCRSRLKKSKLTESEDEYEESKDAEEIFRETRRLLLTRKTNLKKNTQHPK